MQSSTNLQDEVQEGFILQLDGDLARLRVAPNANCDNCGSCNIAHMELLAYNRIQASAGQKVKFTMIQENMLRISFMVFILPLLSIFAGLYTGSMMAKILMLNEAACMTAGFILFLSTAIYIIYNYDKRYKQNKSNFPQIIEVIK